MLEHAQFDLVVRLMNAALQDDSDIDMHGVAAALLPLSCTFGRKLCPGVIQFVYTLIQVILTFDWLGDPILTPDWLLPGPRCVAEPPVLGGRLLQRRAGRHQGPLPRHPARAEQVRGCEQFVKKFEVQ